MLNRRIGNTQLFSRFADNSIRRLMSGSCPNITSRKVEVDIPHAFEAWLKERSGSNHVACTTANAVACYQFQQNACFKDDTFQLQTVTVCDRPIQLRAFGRTFSPNSGTHRIVADLTYHQERFLIAIEEKENAQCRFTGDIVWIGAASARGQAIARQEEFVSNVIDRMIRSSTGISPDIPPYLFDLEFGFIDQIKRDKPPVIKRINRFQVQFVSAEELRAQGCTLSPLARGCLLTP